MGTCLWERLKYQPNPFSMCDLWKNGEDSSQLPSIAADSQWEEPKICGPIRSQDWSAGFPIAVTKTISNFDHHLFPVSCGLHCGWHCGFLFENTNLFGKIVIFVSELMSRVLNLGIFRVEVHIPLQRTLSHEMFSMAMCAWSFFGDNTEDFIFINKKKTPVSYTPWDNIEDQGSRRLCGSLSPIHSFR